MTVRIQRLQPSRVQLTKQQPQRRDEKRRQTSSQGRSFIRSLTSSLVFLRRLWRRAGAKRGPGVAKPSVIPHFWCTAGDRSEWERARAASGRLRRRRGGAGLREFAGSLVYSVVVLTSERTPADTGEDGGDWRLAHVNAVELRTRQTFGHPCSVCSLGIESLLSVTYLL